MLIADFEESLLFPWPQFVRSSVSAAGFQKSQWAVVQYEVVGEKILRGAEPFLEQSPQTFTAYLRTQAGKPMDWPPRMLFLRLSHSCFDSQPFPDGLDLSKWHSCLSHPERSRIHAHKHHTLPASSEASQIYFVRLPGVAQRVINIRDRVAEMQFLYIIAQTHCGLDQLAHELIIGIFLRTKQQDCFTRTRLGVL